MSWDRLEAAAWLASTPTADGNDDDSGDGRGDGGGGGGGRVKTVLMQGGTGDAEVRQNKNNNCVGVVLSRYRGVTTSEVAL